jgi:hypothetical protein
MIIAGVITIIAGRPLGALSRQHIDDAIAAAETGPARDGSAG